LNANFFFFGAGAAPATESVIANAFARQTEACDSAVLARGCVLKCH
jgi:hypothetical protein